MRWSHSGGSYLTPKNPHLMPTSSCRLVLVCVRILAAATRSTMRLCMLSLRRIALQDSTQASTGLQGE